MPIPVSETTTQRSFLFAFNSKALGKTEYLASTRDRTSIFPSYTKDVTNIDPPWEVNFKAFEIKLFNICFMAWGSRETLFGRFEFSELSKETFLESAEIL